jgi:hypothetical protein
VHGDNIPRHQRYSLRANRSPSAGASVGWAEATATRAGMVKMSNRMLVDGMLVVEVVGLWERMEEKRY